MINIYKTDKQIKFKLLCKKRHELKTFYNGKRLSFEENKYYDAILKPIPIGIETNNTKCNLVFVSINDKFGKRFSIYGNIYSYNKPYWTNFKEYFHCPIELERKKKIKKLIKNVKFNKN